jgi:hypothetical protein
LARLAAGGPIDEKELSRAQADFPRDSTFFSLLQAFSLFRRGDLADDKVKAQVHYHLAAAFTAFKFLQEPVNVGSVFSPHGNVPYLGRPHERVLASILLAALDMTDGRCDLALPKLEVTEFLGSRWQAATYGTTAPLVYALMLRCLYLDGPGVKAAKSDQLPCERTLASSADIRENLDCPDKKLVAFARASEGLYRSIRFQLLQKPLLELLQGELAAHPRSDAPSVLLAHMLYEIGLTSALMSAPRNASLATLLSVAAGDAKVLASDVQNILAQQYVNATAAASTRLPQVLAKKRVDIEEHVCGQLAQELESLASKLNALTVGDADTGDLLEGSLVRADRLAAKIERAVKQEQVLLRFDGTGPGVQAEGTYSELARIAPNSRGGYVDAGIRDKNFMGESHRCGAERTPSGALLMTLCTPSAVGNNASAHTGNGQSIEYVGSELWSSSFQATSVMGRRFEHIFRGQPQFGSEVAPGGERGVWSALFLFDSGMAMLADCHVQGAPRRCQIPAYAVLMAAASTASLSGAAWLAGRVINPAADERYVHSLYESGYVLVPAENS